MRGVFLTVCVLFLSVVSKASSDFSLYGLPQALMEYEGTGYREVSAGWELKVKPLCPVGGIRWRHEFNKQWALQSQYWVNRPTYAEESWNARSPDVKQFDQTRLSLQSLWADVRAPLWASPVEVVAGVNGAYQSFRRKNIVYGSTNEPGDYLETHTALGVHMGVHAGSQKNSGAHRPGSYWDSEVLLSHYLWTKNNLTTSGGTIDTGGYAYSFRLEGGLVFGRVRLGVGYLRQMYEIFVPGGRSLPEGSAVSLPINKTDLFGPFISLGWIY